MRAEPPFGMTKVEFFAFLDTEKKFHSNMRALCENVALLRQHFILGGLVNATFCCEILTDMQAHPRTFAMPLVDDYLTDEGGRARHIDTGRSLADDSAVWHSANLPKWIRGCWNWHYNNEQHSHSEIFPIEYAWSDWMTLESIAIQKAGDEEVQRDRDALVDQAQRTERQERALYERLRARYEGK